jgi:hypothetical protein
MPTGNNILQAASISPQVLVSQQLGTTDTALYTVASGQSVKIAHGVLCNVTATMPAPVLTLGATSTTGGTLAAGTYYWKVSALNAVGETLASNEVTATTTGTTSSQPLSWTAVAGAVSYNIYRGTTPGGENVKYNTASTSFMDTGAAGTTASPVTSQTTATPVVVFLSILKSGGTIGDNTHRVVSSYSLAANDSLSLKDYLGGAMLGPGDAIAGYSTTAGAVDVVISGTVHS